MQGHWRGLADKREVKEKRRCVLKQRGLPAAGALARTQHVQRRAQRSPFSPAVLQLAKLAGGEPSLVILARACSGEGGGGLILGCLGKWMETLAAYVICDRWEGRRSVGEREREYP